MEEPPVFDGASQFNRTNPFPEYPFNPVGGSGRPGLVEIDAEVQDNPYVFAAYTEKVYCLPLIKLDIVFVSVDAPVVL